jgi:hypothetical protein
LEKGRGRFAHQFARIERLLTFRDVGQQNIHERMLAVERRSAPVLGDDNPLDRCKIELAERIVLYPKQTSSPSNRALSDRPNYP